jgi:hypothetical protein
MSGCKEWRDSRIFHKIYSMPRDIQEKEMENHFVTHSSSNVIWSYSLGLSEASH